MVCYLNSKSETKKITTSFLKQTLCIHEIRTKLFVMIIDNCFIWNNSLGEYIYLRFNGLQFLLVLQTGLCKITKIRYACRPCTYMFLIWSDDCSGTVHNCYLQSIIAHNFFLGSQNRCYLPAFKNNSRVINLLTTTYICFFD